ncbi:iron-containing alcohol dehydrogenase [Pseudochryseolinea flava]|uniref:Alcohol dehydrogenase n=1 Tax=Pseudochryseolinea flava TaxID=2059302 RepID=A0A364Y8Y7_9BACT|nr:iron-containing alcohol dehydrogenase [Pseudochryseolinea flava]RAW02945.1 alcohol dehydrogenase [Pseudochryseolinea flava]
MIKGFNFAATPDVHFGIDKRNLIPSIVKGYGNRVLLVTGASAFTSSPHAQEMHDAFSANQLQVTHVVIDREPSPAMIDEAVSKCVDIPNVVLAVGGGSVLDAGKAVSAMLRLREPVKHYLEGVGTKSHPGIKVPFVAVSTTSGTGSEATKNAVLSETGRDGFKKSLRHNNFVPDVAILDPELTLSCPPHITASSGMDAFTQLLESYVSTAANPITDALALEGLKRISTSLRLAYRDGSNIDTRSDMAMASYFSGVTLANAGLGLVHGFASALGGYFDIAHGVICSSLMSAANRRTVEKLRVEKTNPEALRKFAVVGKIFSKENHKTKAYYVDFLLEEIASLKNDLKIPTLSACGVEEKHFEKILSASDNKNNPIKLSLDEMRAVLKESL